MKLMVIAMILAPFTGASVLYDMSGSTTFSQVCDDCYELVQLADTYRFFGKSYTQAWVGSNGYLTFDAGESRYFPDDTSAFNGNIMVAPLFSDIDINWDGKISFQETQNKKTLKKARRMIRDAFPGCGDLFKPTSMFITEWFDVPSYCQPYGVTPFFKRDAREAQSPISKRDAQTKADIEANATPDVSQKALWKRNKFQVALITDGCNTFAIFNYEKIHWTTCWDSNKILFNAGDGVGFYWHDLQFPNQSTNVNSAGRWVYKISDSKIRETGCGIVGT